MKTIGYYGECGSFFCDKHAQLSVNPEECVTEETHGYHKCSICGKEFDNEFSEPSTED